MGNMSYCRWENTLRDFRDCVKSVGVKEDQDPDNDDPSEFWTNTIGDDERRAMIRLVEETAELLDRINGISGELNLRETEQLEETVKRIAESFGYYKDGE